MGDNINHPDHYTKGIETIDFIISKELDYELGNVIKYITRAPYKGNYLEDLRKARWYLTHKIQRLETKNKRIEALEALSTIKESYEEEDFELDLDKCPRCKGPADNGIDRCVPPSPYLCTTCQEEETPTL